MEIPSEFSAFIDTKLRAQRAEENQKEYRETFIRSAKAFGMENVLDCHEQFLILHVKVWKKLFDHVVDDIIKHIQMLFRDEPMLMSKRLKYICLAGGLSCSKHFRMKMKSEFGRRSTYKLEFIMPHEPIL